MLDGDYYKHFKKETEYMYMSAGLGFGSNYPMGRIGLEYFGMMTKTWEYSLGFRDILSINEGYKTNPNINMIGNTFIATGSFAKYIGNYWIQTKGYFIPRSTLNQQLVDLTVRRYFQDRFNFIFVRTGWGQVQDMQYLWFFRQYVPQDGYKIAFGINRNIVQRLLFKFEYQREIWFPNEHKSYMNQTLMLGFWWRFNTGIK
jgi:YaiO family outer membrane protein